MARRRFIQDPDTGDLIEVSSDYVPTPRDSQSVLWNDRHYDGMRAPDGADISSRSKHREYMRRTGLTTMDDFKDTWKRAEAKRAEYYKKGGSVSREDVARAIARLERK
jgi:hypothetical protein